MLVVSNLITLFLFIIAAKLLGRKHHELADARARLARIAASDNEIMSVLEATDSDLSRRLLAHIEVGGEQKKLPAKRVLDGAGWKALKREMHAFDIFEGKMTVLRRWVKNGALLTNGQRASLMELVEYDSQRVQVASILDGGSQG